MKPRKIVLDDFELVKSIDELENCSGLIIYPSKLDDGTQLPPSYWRRKEPGYITVTDTTNAEWFEEIRISTTGTTKQYADRVNWWVQNAVDSDDWKSVINDVYNKNGYKVKEELDSAIEWLKKQEPASRKSHLNKFFKNWFRRGLAKLTSRNKRY